MLAQTQMWVTGMDADDLLTTTCPTLEELDRAMAALDRMGIPYRRIDPTPPLTRVALPALVVDREARARLAEYDPALIFSGWIEHRTPAARMPEGSRPETRGACFDRAAIMVLQPCVADDTKIRLTAHVRGDLGPVLPYLNAVVGTASYTPAADSLTYMNGHRMVALFRHRITIAKADEIVDGWLTLDGIRLLVEKTWAARAAIEPSYETRKRPPALEIWKRLPGTNCGVCGETTCVAFALRLWAGKTHVRRCSPVFVPEQAARREALLEMCAGLGLPDE